MGCPRLTYREKEERLNFLGLWKKRDGSKSGEDYYPFGLTFNSYSRENSVPQNFLYNGKEMQTDLGLNVEDYGGRIYDPAIGRFWRIDPLAGAYKMFSPYAYAINNPIRYVDYFGWGPGDRVKKVRSKEMTGLGYVQEGNEKGLRTANTQEALKYMDCAELVTRVLVADKLVESGVSMDVHGLLDFFTAKKYKKSATPRAGAIAIWSNGKDKDGKTLGGHTGVVTAVDPNNSKQYKLAGAWRVGKPSGENANYTTSSVYAPYTFIGFFYPSSEDETPPQEVSVTEPPTSAGEDSSDDGVIEAPMVELKEVTVTAKAQPFKQPSLMAPTSGGIDLSGFFMSGGGGSNTGGSSNKKTASPYHPHKFKQDW